MADLNKVQQAVQQVAANTGIHNLTARANGSIVEIHGLVRSIAEKQNVMRAITQAVGDTGLKNLIEVASDRTGQQAQGNQIARGGPAIGLTHATETPSPAAGARTHKVAKGETLSHIAQRYYGKASEYTKIFEANRDKLSDPDEVREGVELRIP